MSSTSSSISAASSSSVSNVLSSSINFEKFLIQKISEIELKKRQEKQESSLQRCEFLKVSQVKEIISPAPATISKTEISLEQLQFSYYQKLKNCSMQTKLNNPNSFESPLCLFYLYSLFADPISILTESNQSISENGTSSASSSNNADSSMPDSLQNEMLKNVRILLKKNRSNISEISDINLLIEIAKLEFLIFEKNILAEAKKLPMAIDSIIQKNKFLFSNEELVRVKKDSFKKISNFFLKAKQTKEKLITEMKELLSNLSRISTILAKIERDFTDPKLEKQSLGTLKLNFTAKKIELESKLIKILLLVPKKISTALKALKKAISTKIQKETNIVCNSCHEPKLFFETLKRCQNCKIYYCSKECQILAWPEHRKTCLKS